MRKIKTKGLKFKTKPINKGPRYAIALHSTSTPAKTKDALGRIFEVNEALAEVVINSTPVVICKDLEQGQATDYQRKLKGSGEFRVWLESASGVKRMRQMNLKQKSGPAPMPAPEIRKH